MKALGGIKTKKGTQKEFLLNKLIYNCLDTFFLNFFKIPDRFLKLDHIHLNLI